MDMKILLYKYNNYFNRIKKEESTLNDYSQFKVGEQIIKSSFNYGDGVNTTQIVNVKDDEIGDYLILADLNDNILSRWFILEATYTRGNQYLLQLRRDVIIDYKEKVLSATSLIEKATLEDDDPLIYNRESVEFNQIKKSEDLLVDESNSAWVIGYIPREATEKVGEETHDIFPDTGVEVNVSVPANGGEDFSTDTLENWQYYRYVNQILNGKIKKPNLYTMTFKFNAKTGGVAHYNVGVFGDGTKFGGTGSWLDDAKKLNKLIYNEKEFENIVDDTYFCDGNYDIQPLLSCAKGKGAGYPNVGPRFKPNFNGLNIESLNTMALQFNNCMSDSEFNTYQSLNGKVLKVGTEYYTIEIHKIETDKSSQFSVSGNLKQMLDSKLDKEFAYELEYIEPESVEYLLKELSGTASDDTYKLYSTYDTFELVLMPKYTNVTSLDFGKSRYHLDDQPYDMFCMPLGNPFSSEELKIYKNGTLQSWFKPNSLLAMAFATAVGAKLGTKYVYDIQLLPYCPVRYCVKPDGKFDFGDSIVNYITKTGTDEKIGIIFWATHSSFSFNIQRNIPVTEKKVQNQCDMHRLCSPNYNGLFDFNVARNDGVSYFNVDCSYKPYSPYIHINPDFKGLYGQDFNGTRGLICGGDFSLPTITNEWANYQLMNKNYSTIFNRETEHLDTIRGIQRTQEKWSIANGVISGAGAGAFGGSQFGTLGGVVGSVAGGIASVAGGLADLSLSDKAFKENMDLRQTLFSLNLENIKAIPDSLTKVSSFTYNNKLFPFVEYYSCTENEKQLFRDMLTYNGMTVGKIGTIRDYLKSHRTFIKAKLIRLEGLNEDYHLVSEINSELNGGIYI